MNVYLYPGQGSQFTGMGHPEYQANAAVKDLIDAADSILGYALSEVMFTGSDEDLKATRITQPAILLHSIARTQLILDFSPGAVAGHSLGEFSALVAAGALTFEDGLRLVQQRAEAMQHACEVEEGTMAAIVGLEDKVIEEICEEIDDVVVPANYNCPGQLVISGTVAGIDKAVAKLTEAGARRAIILAVGGAFHSPLMSPAKESLRSAIEAVHIAVPSCPVYQNVSAMPTTDPTTIKELLIDQLTSPVRWTQTMQQMIADGAVRFTEVGGRGGILSGFIRRIDRTFPVESV